MSCDHKFTFAVLILLAASAFAFESPVPFAGFSSASPGGPAGWFSNPARAGESALAASAWWRGSGPTERAASLVAEWEFRRLGGAFVYDYYALDSVFRQSYVLLEASVAFWKLRAGVAWEPVAEWVPGDAAWLRYRAKFGLLGRFGGFTLSSWWCGFLDEVPPLPRFGIAWEPSGSFAAFAATDLESVSVGSVARFGFLSVTCSYVFPGFGFEFGVSFSRGGLSLGAVHGMRDENGDWNGIWAMKRLR